MSKSIYYTVPENGSSYKLKIITKDLNHINTLLDGVNQGKFITKEEFKKQYDRLMTLEIRDEESIEVIGYLTTKYIEDLEEQESI